MTFSGQTETIGLKKFVTEDELEEKRKKRQEEWEKVRQPEDPTECPEEVYDPRSLFEQLEAQKQKKQDDYDEQFKMRNQVKGLGEDEANFLNYVSDRQMQIDKQRQQEEATVIRELRNYDSNVVVAPVHTGKGRKSEEKKVVTPQVGSSQVKSQMALLAGAIKRKSSDASGVDKKRKLSDQETNSDSKETPETHQSPGKQTVKNSSQSSVARVIGILPGLGEYDNDTSDSETSSSDSEIDCKTILTSSSRVQCHHKSSGNHTCR